MAKLIALVIALLSTAPDANDVDAMEPCDPSFCCDSAGGNCYGVSAAGGCAQGEIQQWCVSCYTGADSCPDPGRCCD